MRGPSTEHRLVGASSPYEPVARALPGEPDAAMHLDGCRRGMSERVPGGDECHGGRHGSSLLITLSHMASSEIDSGGGELDLDQDVGEAMLNALERTNRTTELLSLPRIRGSELQASTGGTHRVCGHRN